MVNGIKFIAIFEFLAIIEFVTFLMFHTFIRSQIISKQVKGR